ncbi:hypothetical protein KP509_22G024300 [Ceratopteris richardii]|uniref:VQ domain-containing protein n=1 Tax=Ceratopteris richardii TaxID=49495 RepID=A0A8T2S611_CERRI|nr:hypothetical protein KP509_22G024300 [Ceratopteris richardii]
MGSHSPAFAPPHASLFSGLSAELEEWLRRSSSDQFLTEGDVIAASEVGDTESLHRPTHSSRAFQLSGSSPLSGSSICNAQPEVHPNCAQSNGILAQTNAAIANDDVLGYGFVTHPGEISEALNKAATPPQQSPSTALSAQAGKGTSTSKIGKRRSRASKKPPIAVHSADVSNFRAMVQYLTGIPPPHAYPNLWAAPEAPLLKPQFTGAASSLQLPTLDTSSVLLNTPRMKAFQPGTPPSELSSLQAKRNSALDRCHLSKIFNVDDFASFMGALASGHWESLASANS